MSDFVDCGICPNPIGCRKADYCHHFGGKCNSCDEGREIEYGGIVIHVCDLATKSMIFTDFCPCGCDINSKNTILERSH